MRRDRFRRRIAGVIGLGLLLAVAALAIVRPPNPFADRQTFYAVFDHVQGLGAIDRDVRVAGVKVGELGEVERRGDDVRVEVVLHEAVALHRDARVAMRPHTLFEGSSFVDLSPGSPSAAPLRDGATIPRGQTSNYVTLDQALRVLRPNLRRDVKRLAGSGARTLRGEAVDGLQRTLRAAPGLTRPLARAAEAAQGTGGDELTGSVQGLARTVDALERRSDELLPIARRADRTAAALSVDDGGPLDTTLAQLPATLREVRRSAPPVTGVVTRAERLARELTPALPEVRAALREGTPVLRRTIPVARDATPLVRDARLIASRLGRARESLVEMFQLTEPSLVKFDALFEVFNTQTSLGAPSGVTQLVGGAFSGFNAVFRPFQTPQQDPMANGHKGRVGVYVNPAGLLGLAEALGVSPSGGQASPLLRNADPSCSRIGAVSRTAEEQLRRIGACR